MKGIVRSIAQMWPREVFDIHNKKGLLIKQKELLRGTGVYVLYRDDRPYYIGQTRRPLFERLHDHANKSSDKWYSLWNFFSAFEVPNQHVDEVEAILIAAIPTANSARPSIPPVELPREIRRTLAERRRIDADGPALKAKMKPRDFLKLERQLRGRTPGIFLTESFIRAAKNKGRP
jgi:hypothetical protein